MSILLTSLLLCLWTSLPAEEPQQKDLLLDQKLNDQKEVNVKTDQKLDDKARETTKNTTTPLKKQN